MSVFVYMRIFGGIYLYKLIFCNGNGIIKYFEDVIVICIIFCGICLYVNILKIINDFGVIYGLCFS